MQYRGKIPKGGQLADKGAEHYAESLRKHIDFLIGEIEWFADSDQKGLIRWSVQDVEKSSMENLDILHWFATMASYFIQ